jgi:hypothetical protein
MVRVIVSTLSPLDDNRWSYLVEVTEREKRDDVGVFCGLLDRVYVRLCLNHPSESLAFGTFNTLNSCRLVCFSSLALNLL